MVSVEKWLLETRYSFAAIVSLRYAGKLSLYREQGDGIA